MKALGLWPVLMAVAVVAVTGLPGSATAAKGDPTVGATITALRGRLTVHAYEQPAAVSTSTDRIRPAPGHEFSAIDVEACNRTAQPLAINPYQFGLETPNRSRVRPAAATREPALPETQVGPMACVRGWITFEVRRRTLPRSVLFQSGSSFNGRRRLVRWRITRLSTVSTTTPPPAP